MKKSRLFLLVTFLLLAGVLSGCAGGAGIATSWPGLTVDLERETAYVAYAQHVYAINLSNGQERWRFPAEPERNVNFYAAPGLTEDGQLLVGSYNNQLYSLNPDTGQVNWVFDQADDRFVGSALAKDGVIFAPNADQRLYAISSSGQPLWDYPTGRPLWATPIVNGGDVIQPSMDHHLYAIDPETGDLVWSSEDLGGAIVGQPALGDNGDVLYVGTFAGEMLAVQVETGAILWRFPTEGWVWAGPALVDGTLYFGDLDGVLYAVDAASGDELWRVDSDGSPEVSISDRPLVLDDTVYFSTEGGILYAVDAATGNNRWKKELGGKLYAGPQAAGELVLLPSFETDALLIAMEPDGDTVWSFIPEN